MNHYEVLGISADATQGQIKAAFRKMVKQYHPDINPDPSAGNQMILINEAYEVLSDHTTRNLYDLFLQGVPVKTVLEETSPEQRHKAEYVRNRIRKERIRMEKQFRYKQGFYRRFRVVNMIFFAFSLLLTFDYYSSAGETSFKVDKVVQGRFETYIHITNGEKLVTDRAFYSIYQQGVPGEVLISFTSVLYRAQKVRAISSQKAYFIFGTIYSFRNTFSVIMFVFSLIVVSNKRYTDFRLTCGLFAAMCFLYVALMLLTS
ncbi:J domain-containing protein [Ekhidna sp.]